MAILFIYKVYCTLFAFSHALRSCSRAGPSVPDINLWPQMNMNAVRVGVVGVQVGVAGGERVRVGRAGGVGARVGVAVRVAVAVGVAVEVRVGRVGVRVVGEAEVVPRPLNKKPRSVHFRNLVEMQTRKAPPSVRASTPDKINQAIASYFIHPIIHPITSTQLNKSFMFTWLTENTICCNICRDNAPSSYPWRVCDQECLRLE